MKNILKPDIQLFAEGGEGSATSAATTGSAADTNTSNASDGAPNNAQAPATQTSTAQQETQPFKSFATEADFQKEMDFRVQQALKTHEGKLKDKLTPEIKAQLEKEANMTAEQKVQAQLDDIASQKSELSKEKNRIKAESLLVKGGITDEVTRSTMLDSVVTSDETETLKRAQALVDAVGKAIDEKIKAAMKDVKKPGSDTKPKDEKSTAVTFAENIAKRHAEAAKESNKALDYYLKH